MFVEAMQIWAISLGDEGALHQRGTSDFVTALCNSANTLAIVGLANTRRDPKISREIAAFGKIFKGLA